MNLPTQELRRAAEDATGVYTVAEMNRFHKIANPQTVIQLLDEREALREALGNIYICLTSPIGCDVQAALKLIRKARKDSHA